MTEPDLAARAFAPRTAIATTPLGAAPTARIVAITADAVERGSRLFFLRSCWACHGEDAEGFVGPRLAGTSLPFEDALRQVRTPRTGRMPPFTSAQLTDDAVADIYAFVRSLGPR